MDKKNFIKFNIKNNSDLLNQASRFGIVGLSNTIVCILIYYILICLDFNYLLSNVFAFIVSVLNAYYWNSRYVFVRNKTYKLHSFLKTFVSYTTTFTLSNTLLFVSVNYFILSKWLAPLITWSIVIPLSFLLIKFWAMK